MASNVIESKQYLVSTDIGVVGVTIQTVTGYNVEDVVRDKTISLLRAEKFTTVGKNIDMSKPTGARTLPSIWLNNEIATGD